MSETKQILDELGTTLHAVEASAARVQQIKKMRERIESYREIQTTVEIDGQRVHRFQRVNEKPTSPLADEDIEWLVTGFKDDEVVLKTRPSWDSQRLSKGEFGAQMGEQFDVQTTADGTPIYGY